MGASGKHGVGSACIFIDAEPKQSGMQGYFGSSYRDYPEILGCSKGSIRYVILISSAFGL